MTRLVKLIKLISVACCLVLVGCAGGITGTGAKSEFACELPQGVNCFSVQSAYQMSLNGLLPGQKTQANNEAIINKRPQERPETYREAGGFWVDTQLKTGITNATVINGEGDTSPEVQFISPKYIRIWMAPHKSATGDSREAYFMYAVYEPGNWTVIPPKAPTIESLLRNATANGGNQVKRPTSEEVNALEKESVIPSK